MRLGFCIIFTNSARKIASVMSTVHFAKLFVLENIVEKGDRLLARKAILSLVNEMETTRESKTGSPDAPVAALTMAENQ